ncbi:MAG: TlyA family RNA methyltransferase [Clostridia bacterium]|nr:TlyA family RNA methyltransferase [Clostridia bacterium]
MLETKYFDSRTKAKQAIERGEIYLDGKKIDKSSFDVSLDIEHKIEWKREEDFVSLGGYKLSKALKDFDFCVKDFIVADIGASTGGFTDCLIKNGAKKVFAIDLNDGLLHEKLRGDLRVVPLIKNAKNLSKEDFNLTLDLIVADLSFISITQVLPVFLNLIDSGKHLILLIKPQFEVGEKRKFKNGIVRDEKLREQICENVIEYAGGLKLKTLKITTAPIVDGKNVEFLILLKKD